MTIDYAIEYVKEHIKEDIDGIRKEYHVDVSPEVGKILYSFVTHHQNNISNKVFFRFIDVIGGLEKYLRERTKQNIYLHEIKKSGAGICRILKRKDKNDLSALMEYIAGLKNMDLVLNGMDQIFP